MYGILNTMITEMVQRIHQLPISLANQIAAGEVIERPASVLKELLENSIDARSTEIHIHIKGGGIDCIRVRDNGCGIHKDDLLLALMPHATSKISSASDLTAIGSYGFRGEALASMSAVSNIRLSSTIAGATHGWVCEIKNTESPTIVPAPKQLGTQIEIQNLFYNTPVRRAFLKSLKTESLWLEEVFKGIALSQPAIAFHFQIGDRSIKRLPSATTPLTHTKRVALLCGNRFIENALYIETEVHDLKLKGWIGMSAYHRAQADIQYFYVNGRMVRDKVINHAIRQAYGDTLPPGRYAAYVLYFELPLETVDVNVHPTKHEVRFREPRLVHDFIAHTLKEALKGEVIPPFKAFHDSGIKASQHAVHAKESGVVGTSILLGQELLLTPIETGLGVFNIKKSYLLWLEKNLLIQYRNNIIQKRYLLWPQSLNLLDPIESLAVTGIDWDRLGFDCSPIGPHELLIRSVPYYFESTDSARFILLNRVFSVCSLPDCIRELATQIAAIGFKDRAACDAFVATLKANTAFLDFLAANGAYRYWGVDDVRQNLL